MIRISTMMILFAAALLFIGGLIYLMQSVTFQYENITGMSALELSLYGPYINSLTISLSDVVGANLFALSIFFVYIAFRAWQDKFAWIIGFISTLLYAVPLVFAAARSTGPLLIVVAPLVPIAFGLVLAATLDRSWSKPAY